MAIKRVKQPLMEPHLSDACRAWVTGGCQLLGLWGAKHLAGWGVRAYADLVAEVRAELGDNTDYSERGNDQ